MAQSEESRQAIDTLFLEERRYQPPRAFAAQANAQPGIYDEDFEAFWEREARERVTWFEPWQRLYEWEPPYAKWFLGGKLNIAYNCVDRHVEAGHGEQVAYHWEGEPDGERRDVTYADLQREVTTLANALKAPRRRQGHAGRDLPRAWSPRRRSRCSRAPGSARRTPSSSAASPPTRSPTASTTWAARC